MFLKIKSSINMAYVRRKAQSEFLKKKIGKRKCQQKPCCSNPVISSEHWSQCKNIFLISRFLNFSEVFYVAIAIIKVK